jgi:dipeptidyl aminopeptidase/acylaminoacyl peptidase
LWGRRLWLLRGGVVVLVAAVMVVVGVDGSASGSAVSGSRAEAADSGVIAFYRPGRGIFTVRPGGTGLRRVWRIGLSPKRSWVEGLAWSPDGRRLAFVADRSIWVMNADGSKPVRVTGGYRPETSILDNVGWRSPTWSPDGTRIAYTFSPKRGLPRDVWVMNADGSDRQRVARTRDCDEADVDWHPMRAQLVTNCVWGWGARHPRLMNLDGTVRKLLPSKARVGTDSPDWSPDGRRIVFAEFFPESAAISVVKGSGGTPVRLTHDQYLNWQPAWSPDGRRIAFVRVLPELKRDGPSVSSDGAEIFLMNANGTGLTRLTHSNGAEQSPAWQPGQLARRARISTQRRTPPERGFPLMGGTGLEPVTPSLSIRRNRSRPFARVRKTPAAEWFSAWSCSERANPNERKL